MSRASAAAATSSLGITTSRRRSAGVTKAGLPQLMVTTSPLGVRIGVATALMFGCHSPSETA